MLGAEATRTDPGLGERMRAAPRTPSTLFGVSLGHAAGLAAFTQPFHLMFAPVMVGVYVWAMASMAIFLHRGLSHGSLAFSPPAKLFFALGCWLGLVGEPIGWASIHRHHHRHADTLDDPHTPRLGFWYAYMGWYHKLGPAVVEELLPQARDLQQDPLYRLMHHPAGYFGGHAVLAGLVFAWLGPAGLLWCVYLPALAAFHVISTINTAGHAPGWGTRRHETRDDSRNLAWLGLLSLGDSFHHNHHAEPCRARAGDGWREPDPGAWLIAAMERCRLVKDVVW